MNTQNPQIHPIRTGADLGWIQEDLSALKAKDLYRRLRVLERAQATSATIEGRRVRLFCGNDYLGLSRHPEVVQAAGRALKTHGAGAGSARLIGGTSDWHAALEARISAFLGKERTLLFSSGYLANLGAVSALAQAGDLVVLDKFSHASLVDAACLSKADLRVYPHKNLGYLERILERSAAADLRRDCGRGPKRIWIVTDSVFSMDGDFAPLQELAALKNRYGAYLVLDEAHATGVFGPAGKGAAEHFGVSDQVDVHIGTCSKAVGTLGGFVSGAGDFIDYLVNHARTFIFDTALPPSVCAASVRALDLIEAQPELRARLHRNTGRLRTGLQKIGAPVLDGPGPIIPVVIGEERKTLDAAEFLFQEGFLVPAVRYPAVPKGRARLRVTVSAAHSERGIAALLAAFQRLFSVR